MKKVSLHGAKTHLSRLVKEELIITNNGKPVAHVQPLGATAANRIGLQPLTRNDHGHSAGACWAHRGVRPPTRVWPGGSHELRARPCCLGKRFLKPT